VVPIAALRTTLGRIGGAANPTGASFADARMTGSLASASNQTEKR